MLELELSSVTETMDVAEALGRCIDVPLWIGLEGDLGAGKTHFVQGLARGLGVADQAAVVSPTFTLVNEYRGGRMDLIHADLYRIENAAELDEIGLFEFEDGKEIVAVEWSDRFKVMPEAHLLVRLTVVDDNSRLLEVEARGLEADNVLNCWKLYW